METWKADMNGREQGGYERAAKGRELESGTVKSKTKLRVINKRGKKRDERGEADPETEL